MMVDLVNALGGEFRAASTNLFDQCMLGKNRFVKQRASRVETENLSKRRVIEAMRDLVDVREGLGQPAAGNTRALAWETHRIACTD